MLPKEHGAYGQLLFPLVTALAIGKPGVTALTLASAALCAFLAHEPLLVLLGERGVRAAREDRARAWRWCSAFSTLSAASGIVAVISATTVVRLAVAAPATLGAVLGAVIVMRREHTMGGEIISALALASLAFPVALAGGAAPSAALGVAMAFAGSFVVATVCVHAVIMHTRRPPAIGWRMAGAGAAVVATVVLEALARRGLLVATAPWGALPVCAGGFVLVTAPPSARQLRRVGWALVVTTLAVAVILILTLR
jgi:hypothetical protein